MSENSVACSHLCRTSCVKTSRQTQHSRPVELAAQFSNQCFFLLQHKLASLDVNVVANILYLGFAGVVVAGTAMPGVHHRGDALPAVLHASVVAAQCCLSW